MAWPCDWRRPLTLRATVCRCLPDEHHRGEQKSHSVAPCLALSGQAQTSASRETPSHSHQEARKETAWLAVFDLSG
jgi:hypothetical protein